MTHPTAKPVVKTATKKGGKMAPGKPGVTKSGGNTSTNKTAAAKS